MIRDVWFQRSRCYRVKGTKVGRNADVELLERVSLVTDGMIESQNRIKNRTGSVVKFSALIRFEGTSCTARVLVRNVFSIEGPRQTILEHEVPFQSHDNMR